SGILFGDHGQDLLGGLRLQEPRAERRAAEQAADASERLQVLSGRRRGGEEEKEEIRRAAVVRLEVDPLARSGEAGDEASDGLDLGVRDRDPLAESGRAEALALEEDPDERVELDLGIGFRDAGREL